MAMNPDDRLIEPAGLESWLGDPDLVVVDLSHPHHHRSHRIPGARHLDSRVISRCEPPIEGLLPTCEQIQQTLVGIGLTPNRRVVAYDDEGGPKAARFLWTLDLVGHRCWSILNGGLHAWLAEHRPLESGESSPPGGEYRVEFYRNELLLDKAAVMTSLGRENFIVVDARTPNEYHGLDRRAARGGHIPGAINIDWTLNIDPEHKLRLRPRSVLEEMFAQRGVKPECEVVVCCQNMNRAAHTYVTLKTLGYERVRSYPSGWSEWGNDLGAPKLT